MLIHQSLPCFLYNMFTSFVTRGLATEAAAHEFESGSTRFGTLAIPFTPLSQSL